MWFQERALAYQALSPKDRQGNREAGLVLRCGNRNKQAEIHPHTDLLPGTPVVAAGPSRSAYLSWCCRSLSCETGHN